MGPIGDSPRGWHRRIWSWDFLAEGVNEGDQFGFEWPWDPARMSLRRRDCAIYKSVEQCPPSSLLSAAAAAFLARSVSCGLLNSTLNEL